MHVYYSDNMYNIYVLLDGIKFAYHDISVNEDTANGNVMITLVLDKPLTMNLTVQLITTSHSATGESCINYCTA